MHIQNAAIRGRTELFSRILQIAGIDGLPAAILTAGPPGAADYFYFRLYEAIVHDNPMDLAFLRAYVDARPVWHNILARLFLSPGSENLLRLSFIAQKLEAEAEDEILKVQALRADRSISSDEAFTFTSRPSRRSSNR